MVNLSEEQQKFLGRYVNNKGDFYKTVDSLGLDLSHITSWQLANADFANAYKHAKQTVIEHLKQENYMVSLLRVNDALINGVQQHIITQKHRIGGVGETGEQLSEFEVTRTTKNLGVPGWAINQALAESSIVKAVHTLASEGVIPTAVARRILQSANRITTDIKASFDVAAPDSEFINEQKAIALIKMAVLGAGDE